jgi:hypothetical protein
LLKKVFFFLSYRVKKATLSCSLSGERDCRSTERFVALPKVIEICQEKLRLECPNGGGKKGCPGCPTFCRPREQNWCEQQFEVSAE